MYSRTIQPGCAHIVLVASLVLSVYQTEGEIQGPRHYYRTDSQNSLGPVIQRHEEQPQNSLYQTDFKHQQAAPGVDKKKRNYYPQTEHAGRKTLYKTSSLAIDPVWNEVLEEGQRNNSKRAALDLYNMIKCATGCNPLVYKGYGCYCGFLGSGGVVDGIDRCCKMHDWCYTVTSCMNLEYSLPYFVPYKWTCNGGSPYCMAGKTKKTNRASCSHQLCECDREFVECLSDFPCPYKKAMCKSPWRYWQNLFMGLGTGMPMLDSNDIHGPQHPRKPKRPFKYPKPQFHKNRMNIAFG